ncbi:hypothetical protein OROMI_030559 [Orobanche minor]
MEDLGSYGYADRDIEQMILDGLMSTMWVIFRGSTRWYECVYAHVSQRGRLTFSRDGFDYFKERCSIT